MPAFLRKRFAIKRQTFSLNWLKQITFTYKHVLKLIWSVNRLYVVLLFFLTIFSALLTVPVYYLDKIFLDQIVKNIGNPDIEKAVWFVGGIVLARISLNFLQDISYRATYFFRRTIARYLEPEVDRMIGQKLAELDMQTLEDPDFKDRFEIIKNESVRRVFDVMDPVSNIPNHLIGFITAVGFLILLHPLVALGTVIVTIPSVIIDAKFVKKDYQLTKDLSTLNRMWGWLKHYLVRNRNYIELKLLDLAPYLSQEIKKVQDEQVGKRVALMKERETQQGFTNVVLTLYEAGISIWLVFLTLAAKITIGSSQLYLRSLSASQRNFASLATDFTSLIENYVYMNDLIWFLGLESSIENSSGSIKFFDSEDFSVEFRNVWFKYKEDQPWILKGLNLKFSPKENLALVGLNGAGKSTMIKLLARFYDPNKGDIFVGGVNLKDVDLKSYRQQLAILFQEFETYPFSVIDSIGFGDVSRIKNIKEIKQAAEATDMAEFIESLPLKYKNPLEPAFEKGVKPSGGQAQRIGIARMLFRKNAKLLIMDEPTSSVDPEAEEKIFSQLIKQSENKILIFVTHRFSTVRLADRILVMSHGKVTEEGTHEHLMKLDRKYAKLFNLQAKGYK